MAEKKYSLYNDTAVMDQQLAVVIAEGHLALVAGAANRIAGLEYFTTDASDPAEIFEAVRSASQLLSESYSETRVYFNLPQTVLVPASLFQSAAAEDLLELAFGPQPGQRVNVETINTAPAIVNVYRSHAEWQDLFEQHFRAVTRRHLHSALVEQCLASEVALHVQFHANSFMVLATDGRQLKIVRNYSFENDAAVLYHLLNLCRQVGFDVANTRMLVSGLIEADGSLLRLLQKYFHLRLDTAANNLLPPEVLRKYPLHYFTTYFNLVA